LLDTRWEDAPLGPEAIRLVLRLRDCGHAERTRRNCGHAVVQLGRVLHAEVGGADRILDEAVVENSIDHHLPVCRCYRRPPGQLWFARRGTTWPLRCPASAAGWICGATQEHLELELAICGDTVRIFMRDEQRGQRRASRAKTRRSNAACRLTRERLSASPSSRCYPERVTKRGQFFLSPVAKEFMDGIDAGKTVPQIQGGLNEYSAAQAGQFKITITVRAPEPAEQPSKEPDATRTNSPTDDGNRK
jgi:hypothetical protein